MKFFKFWLSIAFSFSLLTSVRAQEKKKIFLYVDTVTIGHENRLVEIKGRGEIVYTFFCKCLPNKKNIGFGYLAAMGNKPTDKRPQESYVSWKKLLDLVNNDPVQFSEKYEAFITEILPNKKFKTNKVLIVLQREDTVLYEKIH